MRLHPNCVAVRDPIDECRRRWFRNPRSGQRRRDAQGPGCAAEL